MEYSSGGRGCGGDFLVFVPAPPSRDKEEFLSLCGLARICHGTGAWWVALWCNASSVVTWA